MPGRLYLIIIVLALGAVSAWGQEARPKKVFAHYMGCWPVASGALGYERNTFAPNFRYTSQDKVTQLGGHVRNWDLVPPGTQLTAEQSADLEIRRALRIGIDGFAIDAWAGGNDARRSLDALFKVAEEKNYPFEITVCIDPTCGGDPVGTVKELLDKHGTSPKLARRDGKPLVFGYMNVFSMIGPLMQAFPGKTKEEYAKLRTTPEGWAAMGKLFTDAQQKIGQPVYFHLCLSAFFYDVDRKLYTDDTLVQAAAALAKYAPAIGGFTWLGPKQDEIARVVKEAGAEWCQPVGHYEKENVPYESYGPGAADFRTSWMGCWNDAIRNDSRLLQLITWNDYGETTNIAPAYNSRYDIYDLTGYYIKWWKTGKEPAPDHDRLYLIYQKYPKDAKPTFPFKSWQRRDRGLEVLTMLTAPATVRLPGRNAEYEAPAGFFRKQFPVTPGPVAAEIVRNGKVVTRLESPEPITDRPFREDNALTCFSTEDERYWKDDFPGVKPFWYSEYGDADNDGLPNWFEMYWFGTWLDFSTATKADPNADPDEDGKTNLQEYREQTDPTFKPPAEAPE